MQQDLHTSYKHAGSRKHSGGYGHSPGAGGSACGAPELRRWNRTPRCTFQFRRNGDVTNGHRALALDSRDAAGPLGERAGVALLQELAGHLVGLCPSRRRSLWMKTCSSQDPASVVFVTETLGG